jgi:predicted nucleotidyltransferase
MKINRLKEQEVNDILEKESIDLSSFKVKDNLNPKIFDKDKHMYKDVRSNLLMIADDFFETLDIGWVDIDDVILTGSLANYNWSKFSDVDIHILLHFEEVDENVDLVREYFISKKSLWNDKHNITIKGYDVELYVQDTNESHVSSGVYSVLWDGWVIEPEKGSKKIDAKKVEQKVNSIVDSIIHIHGMYEDGKYDKTIRSIQTLKEKIKKMRQSGLDRDGEYSFENIAFKVLRRLEYLDKLSDIETLAYDKSLTLVESIKYLKN